MDKVTTHSASKVKNIDKSAPQDIGMAAGTDAEEAFEEGYGKASELAVQAACKGTGAKGGWNRRRGSSWSVQKYFNSGKSGKGANHAGKRQWSKTGGKKDGTGQEKGGKGDTSVWTHCGKLHQGELEQESERCG